MRYKVPWRKYNLPNNSEPTWTLDWGTIQARIQFNEFWKYWEAEIWDDISYQTTTGYERSCGYERSWSGLKTVRQASRVILQYLKDMGWKPPKEKQ